MTTAAVDSDDLSAAIVLLGSVAFMMSMMYLLLNHDSQIRQYSWTTLTAAISNFLGALIARSNGDNIALYVVGANGSKMKTVAVWACICAGWFLLLQAVLLLAASGKGNFNRMLLNLKCFGALFGLTTGFSSLTLWGTVQQLVDSPIPWTTPVVFLTYMSVFHVFLKIRSFIAHLGDDTVDEAEQAWFKFCKETEDAVINLTVAHVTVQSIRYGITGLHPLPTGADPPGFKATVTDGIKLELWADLFLVLFFVSDVVIPASYGRFKVWLKGSIGNAFAFCAFFAMTWYTQTWSPVGGNDQVLLLAMFVTISGFCMLGILHNLSHIKCMPKWFGAEVKAFVGPVSFMIGFAWKQATLSAIDVINNRTPMPKTVNEVVLTIAIAVVVIPAWRWYILPVVMDMLNPAPLPITQVKPLPEIVPEIVPAAGDYKKLPAEPDEPAGGRICYCQIS